ncbi:hypothetical protein GRS48_00475 [Halorubrum sp. JWXQ-INN 858]|uniref:hypothetical protein n=1 Tax=Halorubrum sp. JWXQ-INN 858 TaxID=2690782 RepID=UPI00135B8D63|nr:hypothetical protein [Halorubrum sp. JWXQ-INN 858]MWV63309.1 hypothetical protein [Halorubrum sp. JWXQ-INN 858]
MDTDIDNEPAGRSERRTSESEAGLISIETNPLLQWVLVNGNRWVVSAVALVLVGLGFIGSGVIWSDELVTLFTEEQVVQTILLALFSGIILLVSIALSVNSIVLSQEITALGDQEEEIEETFSFRDSVREHTNSDVSPARPAAFLEAIFDSIRTNAEELSESTSNDGAALTSQVGLIADDIVTQVDTVEGRLENAVGISEVMFAGIQYNYSRQIYAIRQLRVDHEGTLTDSQLENIDELLTTLKYFTIGREYFKTLYFKQELANLSRGLLVIAFPALVYLVYAILSLRAGLLPEFPIVGVPSIIWFVGFTYIVGMIPYTLFSAYVLRTATISIRTLAAGPFILDSSDGSTRFSENDEST